MHGSALLRPVARVRSRPARDDAAARASVSRVWSASALGVLGLAFALRLVRLGEQNIWWDEGLAFWAVSKSWWETTLWTAGDVHPPVFFWLLWAQVRLAGDSEFAARFVTVACGLLTVAAVIPLGRLLGGPRAGWWLALIAAAFLAVGRFPIWWSQELRMYAPATLFVVFATYFAARALVRGDRWRLGYVITASLALWTLYLAAPALLALNVVVAGAVATRLARGARPWALLRDWAIVQGVVVVAYAPWLVLSTERMRTWSTAEPVTLDFFLRLAAVVITTGVSTDIEALWPVVAAAIGVVSVGAVVAIAVRRPGSATLAGWLMVAGVAGAVLAFVFLATQPRSLFYSPRLEARYFLLAAPFVAILAAGALVAIGRVVWPAAAFGAIALLAVSSVTTHAYLDARYVRDEYGSIVQTLDAYALPTDAVVLVSGDRSVVFQYWYHRGVREPRPLWFGLPYTVPATAASAAGDIGPIAERYRRVWLISAEAHLQDPQRQIQAWLDANRPKVLDLPIGANRVALYDRDNQSPAARDLRPQRPLANARPLLGFDLPATRFAVGDVGHVGVYVAPHDDDTPTRVALVDDRGVALEEWVFPANRSGAPTRYQSEFGVFRYTPAGTYRLEATTASGTIPLATIRVERTDPAPGMPVGGPMTTIATPFNDSLRVVGYDLRVNGRVVGAADSVRPGDEIRLSVYWQPLSRLDRPWTAFAHVAGETINPANATPVWAQHDGPPLHGQYPAHQWRPGQIVRDDRVIRLDPATPAGSYALEVGWYWPPTGERLPTADASGRAILQPLVVRP